MNQTSIEQTESPTSSVRPLSRTRFNTLCTTGAGFVVAAVLALSAVSCGARASTEVQWREPPPPPTEEASSASGSADTRPARDDQGQPRLDRVP